MLKKLLLAACAILLLVSFSSASAQEPVHPALQVLSWGIDFFPFPNWTVTVDATAEHAVASWGSAEPLAVVTYERRFFVEPETYTGDEVSEFVDTEWLGVVMDNYDDWEEIGRCNNGTNLVVDMKAEFQGDTFVARYWIWGETDALVSVTAAYLEPEAIQLDALGAALIPALPRCE